MAVFPRRRPRYRTGNPDRLSKRLSLTAAGQKVDHRQAQDLRRLIQPWQSRAFAYYDLLGEIKYAASFYSRALSQLTLYAAERDENGDIVATENEVVKAAVERIQDPGGGRTTLLANYGRLMFLAGEAYLLVTVDADGIERWEMLSTDELRIQEGIYTRYKAPSLAATEYREVSDDDFEPMDVKQAVAYRIWQRHPRYSALADSTMQGVLDLAEELVLLTRAVRARARSRLAGSGILFISEDFSTAPLEPEGDEDPNADPFLVDLTRAMMSPISDEGTSSAVVPLIVRGPIDAIKDGIKHVQIIDPTQLYPETGLRYECVKRIAIGLDMPPAELLGIESATHWSAWLIDEQSWKAHLQPKAQQFVDDISSAYLRPFLREQGVKDWQRYCIAYDATAIINHPDRGKDAKDAYDRRAIGKEALRTALAFNETDAQTEAERAESVGIATRDSSLAWFGTPAPRGGAVETAPGVVEQSVPGDGTSGAATGAEVEPGPPPAKDAPSDESIIGALAQLQGAIDLSVLRAREVAGARLKSLAKKDSELLELISGCRSGLVAAKLGRDGVKRLGVTELDLVSSGRELTIDALRMFRVTDAEKVRLIVERVEAHAARTLYDESPRPMPRSFTNWLKTVAAK